jgi:trichohyalin
MLKFPLILSQFQEETPLSPRSPSIKFEFNSFPEDYFESFALRVKEAGSMKKKEILKITEELLNFSNGLKEQLNEKNESFKVQFFEIQLKNDEIFNEKIRIEENFEELLNEHEKLEKKFKIVEEKNSELKAQVKKIEEKCELLEKENENLLLISNKAEILSQEKEKNLQEITKKLNSIKKLKLLNEQKNLDVNSKIINKVQKSSTSKTPQGTKQFEFEEKIKNVHPKDKIIKNLEKKLQVKTSECEKIDRNFRELANETQELKEKVKLLSFSRTITEGDEETQVEVQNCLRDELFRIDPAFCQGSRFSVISGRGFREIGVQVDRKDIKQKEKRRYFCLSLF